MRKLLTILLLCAGCGTVPYRNAIDQNPQVEPKQAVIIEHLQSMTGEFIPDPLKIAEYPVLSIDPCWAFLPGSVCDSFRIASMNDFVKDSMAQGNPVFFTNQGYNVRPIGNDIGGATSQSSIGRFPYTFRSTKYNDQDSFLIVIDSITANHTLFMRIDAQSYQVNAGDSVVCIDTILARTDSTYCTQRIIITQKILNFGLDSLPSEKYLEFF